MGNTGRVSGRSMLQQGVAEVQLIGGTGAGELRSLCRQIFKSAANLIVSKTLWAEIAHVQLCEPGTSPVPGRALRMGSG